MIYFNPDNFVIKVPLDDPKWLAPIKWNQAGFDSMFVHPERKIIRFVQVTRQTQSFDSIHFCSLMINLRAVIRNNRAYISRPNCIIDQF